MPKHLPMLASSPCYPPRTHVHLLLHLSRIHSWWECYLQAYMASAVPIPVLLLLPALQAGSRSACTTHLWPSFFPLPFRPSLQYYCRILTPAATDLVSALLFQQVHRQPSIPNHKSLQISLHLFFFKPMLQPKTQKLGKQSNVDHKQMFNSNYDYCLFSTNNTLLLSAAPTATPKTTDLSLRVPSCYAIQLVHIFHLRDLQQMMYWFHHPLAATSRFLRPPLSRVTHPAYPSKEYVLQAHTPVWRRRRGLIINGYHRLHGCRYNYQLSSHRWGLQKMFTQSELLPIKFIGWINLCNQFLFRLAHSP